MDIKLMIGGYDVTDYAEQITWSGDLQQISRTVSAKLERRYRPDCGDRAELYYGGTLLFRGMVMYVDMDAYTNSIECCDAGIYLANNSVYKEYCGTPQQITRQICGALGIPVGTLAEKKAKTKVTATGSMSAFKAIERAYEGERRHAKQYTYRIGPEGKLHIEKAGSTTVNVTLREEIESARRSRSIKSMVNYVAILTDKGKKVDAVENSEDRRKYGTFAGTYKKQKDKHAREEARDMLQRLERTGSVSATGDIRCIAGRAVNIEEKLSRLTGRQIIKSDKHTFVSGGYTMTLEFYYE